MIHGLTRPEPYLALLQNFPPRPITSEAELATTQAVVDALLDRPALTADEQDYLNVLGALIYEYEQTLEPLPDIYGVELLKVLMSEQGLRQKDLVPIFKTESIVSDVLHGRRKVTLNHIQRLAKFFAVSPIAFLPSEAPF
ncbi:MAG: transcriptional regulator [Aphanocapsa sp. GSE-SYN-MK-11-07L]|jgi:HTH-type transcriptional regulator/antitoxin HigA|nr:transcriptional regulator [Aphanocapsa sp. GSE-SYN-MK-11-07L]